MNCLLYITVSKWYPMKDTGLFFQSFNKHINHLPPMWYLCHVNEGDTVQMRALKETLYCYWEKKVTMAMIFSRQVKVWTGTFFFVFLVVFFVFFKAPFVSSWKWMWDSSEFISTCVGKEGSGMRCVQHRRKSKKKHCYVIWNTGCYTVCT